MEYQSLLIEQQDKIATITINRPDALNAINQTVMSELKHFFTENFNDFNIRGVILTGAGSKAFVAGADIKQFATLTVESASELSKYGQDTYFKIEQFHAPVIALVNGFALGGGCELAMACHMRIATPNAMFGQPEVNLGLIPGYGGTQRLVRLIGKPKAIEYLLTANMITADEALKLGLINYVVDHQEAKHLATKILSKIAKKAPIAVKEIIECVALVDDETKDGYKKEYEAFGTTMLTDDGREGAAAFVEKRKAVFKGS